MIEEQERSQLGAILTFG